MLRQITSGLLMIVLIAPNTSPLAVQATGSEAEQDAEKNPDKGGTVVSDDSKELHKEGTLSENGPEDPSEDSSQGAEEEEREIPVCSANPDTVLQLESPDAVYGYGEGWGGDVFIQEHSTDGEGNPTAEGELFGLICSETGRAYDLTEYVNDTNRKYAQALTAYTVNSGATENYSYNGNQRLSRNNIWNEARGVDRNETSFYGYNAERYNPNTGLEYLRARDYNAEIGSFFQEDTYLGNLREPLTLNRYAYVMNSPLTYMDPTGRSASGRDDSVKRPTTVYDGTDDEI